MSDDFKNTSISVEAIKNLDRELQELRLERENNKARQNSEAVVSIVRGILRSRKIVFIGLASILWVLFLLFFV
jgi:hypothetical protein